MSSKRVTVDGEDAIVEKTDDGFEARAARDEVRIRAVSEDGVYGFEVPLDADFYIGYNESTTMPDPHYAAAFDEDDLSDLAKRGATGAQKAAEKEYDRYAAVSDIELVFPDE